tara:strand:- start:511 stop:894 length:384 start_codon:yes stop_codon:yes gene_type:complete
MRGGAVIFGPQVRSHAHKLPKRIRALALKMALSNKLKEGKLKVISDFKISKPKTSFLTSKLVKMEIDSALFVDGLDVEKNFKHAVKNIPKTDFLPISGINVYDIIRRNFLIISEKALLGINERFRNE